MVTETDKNDLKHDAWIQPLLVQAISEGIGTGLVENVDIPPKFDPVHPTRFLLQHSMDNKQVNLMLSSTTLKKTYTE